MKKNEEIVEEEIKEETPAEDETPASDDAEIIDTSDAEEKEENNGTGFKKYDIDDETILKEYIKKKKTIIITILSVLLVIDLVVLILYLIGIDKIVSFIK